MDPNKRSLPTDGIKAPTSQITVAELLRAVFFESLADQGDAKPRKPAAQDISREVIEAAALYKETTWDAAPPLAPLASTEVTTVRRVLLGVGIVFTLTAGYLAQLFIRAGSYGGGLLVFVLAGIPWLTLLAFEIAPPDGGLLKRGPRIEGPAGARAVLPLTLESLNWRMGFGAAAFLLSLAAFVLNSDNTFTLPGVITWVLSITGWLVVVAEQSPLVLFGNLWRSVRSFRARPPTIDWQLVMPVSAILIGAALLRLYQLDITPNEMTSDHVEKVLDAWRISQGFTHVFFRNNGGREAIQFYLVFLANRIFGTGYSFLTLKLVSAFEALLLIPVMVRLGREYVDRQTGLFSALLVAVAWWHIMLARLALRIVLTPLIFALLLIVLGRGISTGWRRAWVWAGIWMGIGVYAYQALRITPLVALAAFAAAVAGPVFNWLRARISNHPNSAARARLALHTVRRQGSNLIAAGVIALAFFVPLLRVWQQFPDDLWNRVVNRTTSSEISITRPVLSIFAENYRDALLMFHVAGDSAWINAPPDTPAMDPVTGVLLVLGVLAWLIRLKARGSPADTFLLLAALIMLLPTALAVAFPIENPSYTRASGVLPVVFLLAAWPLTLIWERIRVIMGRAGILAASVLLALLIAAAAYLNFQTYFTRYAESYRTAALNPSEVAHAVRDIIGPDAPLGGVWLVGWPYWHDYRAIGIEAGQIDFQNAILDSNVLVSYLENDLGRFSSRPLVFIVHPDDSPALSLLSQAFPTGHADYHPSSTAGRDFILYTVTD